MSRPLVTLLVSAAVVSFASAAEAQIYTWRGAHGELVLSDVPRTATATTVPVRGTTAIRATRTALPVPDQSFDAIIVREASRHAVRPELVRAIIQVESAFNPRARSPKGAMGLMQLMPATATDLRVGNPYDAGQNIRGGVAYLRRLLDRYDGNEELALAALQRRARGSRASRQPGAAVP